MVATRRHPDGDFPDPTATPPTTSPSKTSSPITKQTHQPRPTSKPHTHSSSSGYTHLAPYPITLWLLLSLPLVIWDTCYVFLRPHTMPGGRFHSPIWTPYALYATIDYVYGWPAWNQRSGFTAAQASLNVAETVIYGYYLWVLWTRGRAPRRGGQGKGVGWFIGASEEGRRKIVDGASLAVTLAFSAAVMTVSKTVLYCEHSFLPLFEFAKGERCTKCDTGLHEYYSGFANIGHNDFITVVIYWIIPNGAWLVVPIYMISELGKEIVDALDGSSHKTKR